MALLLYLLWMLINREDINIALHLSALLTHCLNEGPDFGDGLNSSVHCQERETLVTRVA